MNIWMADEEWEKIDVEREKKGGGMKEGHEEGRGKREKEWVSFWMSEKFEWRRERGRKEQAGSSGAEEEVREKSSDL